MSNWMAVDRVFDADSARCAGSRFHHCRATPLFAAVADIRDRSDRELGLSLYELARRFDQFGQSPVELQKQV
jgi:hypothetical protein